MKRSGSCQEVVIPLAPPLRSETSFEDTSNDAERGEIDSPRSMEIASDELSVLQKSLMMLISNPPGSYADSKVTKLCWRSHVSECVMSVCSDT